MNKNLNTKDCNHPREKRGVKIEPPVGLDLETCAEKDNISPPIASDLETCLKKVTIDAPIGLDLETCAEKDSIVKRAIRWILEKTRCGRAA